MSDEAGRRDQRKFEPPPWERDQFEELARSKAAQAAQEEREGAEAAAARETASAAAGPPETGGESEAGTAVDQPPARAPDRPATDAKMQAMLIELSAEETSAVKEVRRGAAIAAWVLAAAGSVMLGYGIALLIRGGTQGLAGSGMIVVVGMFVVGFALWLGYRASGRQGS